MKKDTENKVAFWGAFIVAVFFMVVMFLPIFSYASTEKQACNCADFVRFMGYYSPSTSGELNRSKLSRTPKVGDLAFWTWPLMYAGHVAIVVSVDGDDFIVIEGGYPDCKPRLRRDTVKNNMWLDGFAKSVE